MDDQREKNKIVGISQIGIIINGDVSEIKKLSKKEANQVGKVVNSQEEIISEITPAIIILNVSEKGWHSRFRALVDTGADINARVQYHGKETTAHQLLVNHRGGDNFLK